MSLKIVPEPGESVIFEEGVCGFKKPVVLGVSNQAVYLTKEQHFARESWRLERIPLETVTHVYVAKEKKIVPLVIGALFFSMGLLFYLAIAWNVYRNLAGTKVSGWPLGFMVLGAVIPFIGSGRQILFVQAGKKLHKWKPELLDGSKDAANDLQSRFVAACREVGVCSAEI
jgi:hypothetical protein